MLKRVDEFGKWVLIAGFRNVKMNDVEDFLSSVRRVTPSGVALQVFDANSIASWEHLYFAVLNALAAFAGNRNISRTLAVEVMLYASAQHQIEKATKSFGIKRGSDHVAVAAVSDSREKANLTLALVSGRLKAEPDDSILEISKTKMRRMRKVFEITDSEIRVAMKTDEPKDAVTDLVIERMALLATHR